MCVCVGGREILTERERELEREVESVNEGL